MSNITKTLVLKLEKDNKLLENMSAAVKVGEHIFLASDEKTFVSRVSKISDNTYGEHKPFELREKISLPLPEGEDDEIDMEGFDYDGKYLWLVGSHSTKRKKVSHKPEEEAKDIKKLRTIVLESNRYILARVPVVDGELVKEDDNNVASQLACDKVDNKLSSTSNDLIKALEEDDHIKDFLKIPSKDNGFDIEGLAVRKGKVFLGLRGPVLRGIAIVLEIELKEDPADKTLLKLKDFGEGKKYKKHFLDLNGLGVRDLCAIGDDLYVLAGPTMTQDGLIGVFRWVNGVNASADSLDIPSFAFEVEHTEGKNRAEGLALYSQEGNVLSFLVVYDSPDSSKREGKDSLKVDVISFTLPS